MKPEILPEERVSRRRLTPLRKVAYALATPLALLLIRAWWRSCRIVSVTGAQHPRRRSPRALAAAVLLAPARTVLRALPAAAGKPKGLKLGFLVSPSVDGEVPAAIARRLGAQVIRSPPRAPALRLRDLPAAGE
jgi:lysophospholipid acyltransferase (LPLAT)-like uncharacterized protein